MDNINIKDEHDNTPLILAMNYDMPEIIKLLISKGANLNIRNKLDRTPLMIALDNGMVDIAKILIGKGADIHVKNKYEESALTIASEYNMIEIINLLIDKDANVMYDYNHTKSPLYHALRNKNLSIINKLIEKGAFINNYSDENISAIDDAIKYNLIDVLLVILNNVHDLSGKNIQTIFNYVKFEKTLGEETPKINKIFEALNKKFIIGDITFKFGQKEHIISVNDKFTVLDIKQKIAGKLELPVDNIILITKMLGKLIEMNENERILSDYGIPRFQTNITVLPKIKSGTR